MGTPHDEELAYASQRLSSIEVNGTFYRTQSPETFQKWYAEAPDDFIFALKAHRSCTNRRSLAEAGEAVDHFLSSGILELREKLGPINWQLGTAMKFDAHDLEEFLKLLPRDLRHAVEVRHESFKCEEFIALAREYKVAVVVAGDSEYPVIPDPTGPFVYGRIMGTIEQEPNGYSESQLDLWTGRVKAYASGQVPADLPSVSRIQPEAIHRDVYLYVISGFKQANPAAAMCLAKRV
jgi:uncharacterized protein YecE (DUF72 family)